MTLFQTTPEVKLNSEFVESIYVCQFSNRNLDQASYGSWLEVKGRLYLISTAKVNIILMFPQIINRL